MARKKKEQEKETKKVNTDGIVGLVGSTTEQAISETLEINYMPYAIQEHPKLYIVHNAKYNCPEKYAAGIIYHVHSGYLMVYVSAGALGAIALALFMLLTVRIQKPETQQIISWALRIWNVL